MKIRENTQIPNIVREYIINMLDTKQKSHIRQNYRDIVINIRDIADEAIKKYDKDEQSSEIFKKKK
jgi:hypothetical protein